MKRPETLPSIGVGLGIGKDSVDMFEDNGHWTTSTSDGTEFSVRTIDYKDMVLISNIQQQWSSYPNKQGAKKYWQLVDNVQEVSKE